jgi:O-antigen/teichoic acid export membrane protein
MTRIDLKKNILIGGSFRALVMTLSFITGWLVTRWLGVEMKGRYSYLLTTAGFVWMVTDFGFHKSIPYLIRKKQDTVSDLIVYSCMLFIGMLILFSILGLVAPEFWSNLLKYNFSQTILLSFILIIVVSPFNMQSQFIMLGMDKVSESALMQYWAGLIMLAAVVVGIVAGWNQFRLEYVLWVNAIITLVVTSIFLARIARSIPIRIHVRPETIKSAYNLGFRAFISSLIIGLLIRFDIILVRHFLNFSQVGLYSVAANIVNMLQIAANVVGALLFVRLSDSDTDEESWIILRRLYIMFFIFLSFINLLFIIFGRQLLILLYGPAFEPSYAAYLFLIPATYGLTFGSLFNTYIWSKGFPLVCIIMPLIALILNVVLNIWWIPKWGIIGASTATSIAYLGWFFALLFYENHRSGKKLAGSMVPIQDDFDFLIGHMYQLLSKRKKHHGKTDDN